MTLSRRLEYLVNDVCGLYLIYSHHRVGLVRVMTFVRSLRGLRSINLGKSMVQRPVTEAFHFLVHYVRNIGIWNHKNTWQVAWSVNSQPVVIVVLLNMLAWKGM